MVLIANYNLGSVQGEVRIKYDGDGIKEAQDDVKTYRDEMGRLRDENGRFVKSNKQSTESIKTYRDAMGRLRDENGRFVKSNEQSTESIRRFGNLSRLTADDIANLGKILTSVSKIPVLLSATQEVVQFAGAIAPAVGVAAALPAVLLSAAAAGATLKVGMTGMGDAMKAVAEGDAAALEKAMAKLAPSAQAVVREVQALKPVWDALRLDVQQRLFEGLNSTINLLGNTYLPVLRTGMGQVATSLNEMAKLSAEALLEPSTVASLGTVFANTSVMIDNMGGALGNVIAGIINMAGAGSVWLDRWTQGADTASISFLKWTQSAEGQQKVNEWIERGALVLEQLGAILANLWQTAGGVWTAMNAGSGGVLENLIQLTQRMNEWVNSAQGQETLIALFNMLHQIFNALVPIIGTIVLFVGQLATWFGQLPAPVQSALASFIAFSLVFGKILSLGAPVIGFLIKYRTEIATVGGWIGKLGGWVGTAIGWIVRLGATFMAQAVRIAASWLIAMGPIGWVIAAVIALVALIIYNWDTVKAWTIAAWTAITSWLSTAWNAISTTATTVWGAITGFFTTIWNNILMVWNTIWGVIGGVVTTIWNAIVTTITTAWEVIKTIFITHIAIMLAIFFSIWNPIWALIQFIWNGIVAFLTMVWNGIVSLATTVWTAIKDAVVTAWNALVAFIMPIVQTISNAISTAWNAISSVTSSVWNAISSTISSVWNTIYGYISSKVQAAWSVIQSVWNTVSGFLSGIWNSISSAASSLWNSIYNAIKGPLDRTWQAIVDVGNRIKGIAGQALSWLVDAGRNVVTGLWNGIAGMAGWLYSRIMSWVRSAVPAPILSFLGIASPSKFMQKEVGRNIPTGIAAGVEDTTPVAEKAAASMAAAVGQAARVATDQEMSVRTSLLPSTSLQGLPPELKTRLGSLAVSAGSAASTATSVMSASTTGATNTSNNKSMVIDKLTVDVKGIIDPTDPVSWRAFGEDVRELLTEVEASYR